MLTELYRPAVYSNSICLAPGDFLCSPQLRKQNMSRAKLFMSDDHTQPCRWSLKQTALLYLTDCFYVCRLNTFWLKKACLLPCHREERYKQSQLNIRHFGKGMWMVAQEMKRIIFVPENGISFPKNAPLWFTKPGGICRVHTCPGKIEQFSSICW